uniref:Glutaredoxin-2, mitochondrial n=1 Tax=Arion vulgaris TaxID=1028688 RepID=A0A0B6ZB21_9EUPU
MDSSVDMSPEEYKATGDHHLDGAASECQEQNYIQDLISKNRIVIFSKSHCPYCDDSKTLLNNMGVNYKTVELDKIKEGNQLQNVLGRITDARTVPRIFIDGQCVGGNSDLKTLNKSGILRDLIKDMQFLAQGP